MKNLKDLTKHLTEQFIKDPSYIKIAFLKKYKVDPSKFANEREAIEKATRLHVAKCAKLTIKLMNQE